jgi:hypothetical protein
VLRALDLDNLQELTRLGERLLLLVRLLAAALQLGRGRAQLVFERREPRGKLLTSINSITE